MAQQVGHEIIQAPCSRAPIANEQPFPFGFVYLVESFFNVHNYLCHIFHLRKHNQLNAYHFYRLHPSRCSTKDGAAGQFNSSVRSRRAFYASERVRVERRVYFYRRISGSKRRRKIEEKQINKLSERNRDEENRWYTYRYFQPPRRLSYV